MGCKRVVGTEVLEKESNEGGTSGCGFLETARPDFHVHGKHVPQMWKDLSVGEESD